MNSRILYSLLFLLALCSRTYAQDVATQFAVGQSDYLDTYLSPEKYRGPEFRFVSEVLRKNTMLQHEGAIAYTHNRSRKAHELSGHYDFTFALMKSWSFANENLTVRVGGMADFWLGFTYNTRNSANNPAQGYASLAIGPNVMASYKLADLIKSPSSGFAKFLSTLTVNYQMRMPWLGLMFSPAYGQSYYEIFSQGNYDHNIVFTSLATFQMRQQVSIDIPIKNRTSLRIGYLSDIRQAKPNSLKQHIYYNAATIGVVIKK